MSSVSAFPARSSANSAANTASSATAGEPGTVGNVMVTFFTTSYPASMPEQAYSVPVNVLPDGLCTLVQSVLKVGSSQKFDFLYNDEYITTTLERFLSRRGVSFEDLVNIEYTPALQAKEGSLLPHDDWVSSVRAPYLGDGETLLTGAYDHCVRLWDGESCLALGTFHKECVKEVALRPRAAATAAARGAAGGTRKRHRATEADDFEFASCSKDGFVAGWRYDAKSSQFTLLGSIAAHTDGVDSVCVSPVDGRLVATAGWDAAVKVYEWTQLTGDDDERKSKKHPLLSFTDHTRPVLCCRFSEATAGAQLYSAGLDGNIKALDVEASEMTSQYVCEHPVNSIAAKPVGGHSGDLLLAACTDNRARLFDTRQPKSVVKTFSGHRQWLYSVCWLWSREDGEAQASGELFATASEDSTVRIYDLRSTTAALLTLDTQHTDAVLDVTYAGQSIIASGGKDNKTKSFTVSKDQ